MDLSKLARELVLDIYDWYKAGLKERALLWKMYLQSYPFIRNKIQLYKNVTLSFDQYCTWYKARKFTKKVLQPINKNG